MGMPAEQKSPTIAEGYVSLFEILDAFGAPMSEEHAWALAFQACKTLQRLWAERELKNYTSEGVRAKRPLSGVYLVENLKDVRICPDGTVHTSTADAHDPQSTTKARTRKMAVSEQQLVQSVGVVLFRALDFRLGPDEQRSLSPAMDLLLDKMTSACEADLDSESHPAHHPVHHQRLGPNGAFLRDEDNDSEGGGRNSAADSEGAYDEGIHDVELDDETRSGSPDVESDGLTLEKVIQRCSAHMSLGNQADSHYRAVCRAFVAEWLELTTFLREVSKGTKELRSKSYEVCATGDDDSSSNLDELGFQDWARLWVQVIRELRQGVVLKKVCLDHRPQSEPSIEYELTPYEMLLDDIRSRRYKLNKVMVNGELPPRVKKDAFALILEFIRSRPPLVPVGQRRLKQLPPKEPPLHERLMDAIKQQHRLRHVTTRYSSILDYGWSLEHVNGLNSTSDSEAVRRQRICSDSDSTEQGVNMKLKHVSVLIETPQNQNFLVKSKNSRNNNVVREVKDSKKRGSKTLLKPNGYFDSGLMLEKHDEVDSDIDVNFDDLEDLGEGIEETACYSPAFSGSDTCGGLSLSSTTTNDSDESSPSFQSKSQNFSQRRLIHVDLMFSDDELEDSESVLSGSSLTKHPSIEFLNQSPLTEHQSLPANLKRRASRLSWQRPSIVQQNDPLVAATTRTRKLWRRHSIDVCDAEHQEKLVRSDPFRKSLRIRHELCLEAKTSSDTKDSASNRKIAIVNKQLECLSLTLEEVAHIRSVMTKAELETLLVTPQLYDDVAKSKVCFTCRKSRFNVLFSRPIKCHLCERSVCDKCSTKMHIPTHRFDRIPVYMLSPSTPPEDCAPDVPLREKKNRKKKDEIESAVQTFTSGSAPSSPNLSSRTISNVTTVSQEADPVSVTPEPDDSEKKKKSWQDSISKGLLKRPSILRVRAKLRGSKTLNQTDDAKSDLCEKLKAPVLPVCRDCKYLVRSIILSNRNPIVKSHSEN